MIVKLVFYWILLKSMKMAANSILGPSLQPFKVFIEFCSQFIELMSRLQTTEQNKRTKLFHLFQKTSKKIEDLDYLMTDVDYTTEKVHG